MKFELKKVKYAAFLSEETNAFTADVYIDGAKAGVAQNQGHGGPTDVHFITRELAEKAYAWVKTQPPHKYEATKHMEAFEVPESVDGIVDRLLEEHLRGKEEQKKTARIAKLALKAKAKGQVLLIVTYPHEYISIAVHPDNVEPWKKSILIKHGANGVAQVIE